MGWLKRVKRNVWVDLYGEFDEKGNDIRHVRVLPLDLERLIAIAEFYKDYVGKYGGCPMCHYKMPKGEHEENCPYHEGWKP